MLVEIDGQQYDVPDNATPEHIQKSLGLKPPSQESMNTESTGLSGVLGDAASKSLQAIYSLPSVAYNAPGEIYGALKQLSTIDPTRRAQNIVGGLGELGHAVLSGPGNIRDYLVKKQLASKESPSFRLPESILPKEYNYPEALGRKGEEPGDALISSIPSMAAGAPFEAKLFSALKELPLTKRMASKPFRQARELVEERGVDKLSVPKELIHEASGYFNKNNISYKDLLNKARLGNYDALHTLQSDLGSQSRQLLKFMSPGSDKIRGLEINNLRQKILSAMKQDLTNQGHEDIAALRQKGANKFRTHMKYRKAAAYGLGALLLNHPAAKIAHKAYGLID